MKTAKEAIELSGQMGHTSARPMLNQKEQKEKTCTNCGYNFDTKINTYEELNQLKEKIFEN